MQCVPLPSPAQIKHEYPLRSPDAVMSWRSSAKQILERTDPRLAIIMGPCSIHDPKSALEYAMRLKELACEIDHRFFPIMRIFVEKPRTKLGWKGMLYDPHLDGTYQIATGLRKSQELMLQITELGIPCAAEILDPLAISYFDDLLTWGLIGARTSASQPHRQVASGLSFPVGFKNDCQGLLDVAIAGICASQIPHTHIGIDSQGYITALTTSGNPLSHLVLRGSDNLANYDAHSIDKASALLQEQHLPPRLLVDCSHGNCGKDYQRQKIVFESVVEQSVKNRAIAGLMLESHLFPGKQLLGNDPTLLYYGVSITDPCLDWENTENLLKHCLET